MTQPLARTDNDVHSRNPHAAASPTAHDPVLSPEEVSAMLGGVPLATLKRWRSERTGPVPLHIGRHVRYRRSAVEAWLIEKDREAEAWMAS
jgi:predicted DNA-binding transcriptional regulator AlpA